MPGFSEFPVVLEQSKENNDPYSCDQLGKSGSVFNELVKKKKEKVKVTGRAPKGDFLWIIIHILVKSWQHDFTTKLISVEKSNKHSGGPQDF